MPLGALWELRSLDLSAPAKLFGREMTVYDSAIHGNTLAAEGALAPC